MSEIRIKEIALPILTSYAPLPLFGSDVQAGFPSSADDHVEKELDLHELMVEHPAATFFVRVQGDSMCGAGIFSGDLLVVDRSKQPAHGKIIVAILQGEFTVKRYHLTKNKIELHAENDAYSPIAVNEESDFQLWGVVTYVIHKTP